MKFIPCFLFALLLFFRVNSQNLTRDLNIKRETWEDKPQLHTLSPSFSLEPAVFLEDRRRVEYVDDAKNGIQEYYTLHKIIHLNDDKGIEEFNKIYLGFSEKSNLVEVKARTILPNGKIITLNEDNIKEVQEKDGAIYKIFALEGLERGCEVEYYYTIRKNASFFGREIMQTSIPCLLTSLEMISPERLVMELKPFNCQIASRDTILEKKRYLKAQIKDIPGREEEKYAANLANLYRIEYKLSYNLSVHPNERIFTWNELAKRIFTVYSTITGKEKEKVGKLVEDNSWSKLGTEVQKITAVENFLKTKFKYDHELTSPEANKLTEVLDKKISGEDGLMKLYSSIFQNLGVKFQYVLTGDRNSFGVDQDFENWINCDNLLIYFPTLQHGIAPVKPEYRYPWFPPTWGSTLGLFCRNTTIGGFSTAFAEIQPIELESYDKSLNNMEMKIGFNPDLDSLILDQKHIYSGYSATAFRTILNSENQEGTQRFIKIMAKQMVSSENVLWFEILHVEFENENLNLPFVLHIQTKSGELIEKAGNKILIKMGLVIGPQVEMYQEKPRKQAIYTEFGHIYDRNIQFTIPSGYQIKNPKDLIFNQTYKDKEELTMGFTSNYELKGNILNIHIIELYTKIDYPLSQFKTYQSIINASSDFNKVVLILEKK